MRSWINCSLEKSNTPPDEKDLAALPVYIELLDDVDADVREYAALTIGEMGPPAKAAIPRLTALLQDDNRQVRRNSLVAIGCLGRQADLILPFLKDEDWLVRWHGAKLLGKLGQANKAVILALNEALDDPDEQVRVEAAQALKTLNSEGDR